MKIELVKTAEARTRYSNCPLCEGTQLVDVREGDCSGHPLYQPSLPATIQWRGCENCGHIFTDGYFTDETLERVLSRVNPAQLPGPDVERHRPVASRIVSRVSQVRGEVGGVWLDVGIGNGCLFTTAAEFGYEAVGLDLRRECVDPLVELGYDARCHSLEDLEGEELFDVISMADSLEHMPFPVETLRCAHRLLKPEGVIFVSMPNVDTFVWRSLDQHDRNPYWGELEHYHNFSREHLYWLLRRTAFEPCHYGVSERYRAGMEVIAFRLEGSVIDG